MTSAEKIDWLSRYKSICRRIWLKIAEKNEWSALATNMSPVYSDMPKGGEQQNKIETATEKIDELGRMIEAEISDLLSARTEIEQAIYGVTNAKYREILERRYIQGQRWEQISVQMSYEYHYTCRMHKKAIKSLNIENRINKDTT